MTSSAAAEAITANRAVLRNAGAPLILTISAPSTRMAPRIDAGPCRQHGKSVYGPKPAATVLAMAGRHQDRRADRGSGGDAEHARPRRPWLPRLPRRRQTPRVAARRCRLGASCRRSRITPSARAIGRARDKRRGRNGCSASGPAGRPAPEWRRSHPGSQCWSRSVSSVRPSAENVSDGLSLATWRAPRTRSAQLPRDAAIQPRQPQRDLLAGPGERRAGDRLAFAGIDAGEEPRRRGARSRRSRPDAGRRTGRARRRPPAHPAGRRRRRGPGPASLGISGQRLRYRGRGSGRRPPRPGSRARWFRGSPRSSGACLRGSG